MTAGERLARLEANQDTQGVVLNEIKEAVCGKADSPGLKGRMDRIETSVRVFKWVAGVALALAGTATAWWKHLRS
ncbi:MAG: hypothetical protein AAB295_10315 [Chloroflexota bacterium]